MTDESIEAIQVALGSLAAGDSPGALKSKFDDLYHAGNVELSVALLELAADALELSGASRQNRIEFAIRAAAMIRAGVDPGVLDEVSWWRIDDLWIWAVDSLVVYIRVAAERTGEPVGRVCELLAARHSVDLTART
jgi:hypothetical protein